MSIKLMSAIWDAEELSDIQLLTMLALADHANDDGVCWPSLSRIARKIRRSERQTRRILRALESSGWVTRENRPGKSHVFIIHPEPQTPDTAMSPPQDVTPDTAMSPPPRTQLCPPTPDTAMSPEPSYKHKLNHHNGGGRGDDSTPSGVNVEWSTAGAGKSNRAEVRADLVGNVYRHYEDNVGLLTPIIADNLSDLVDEYGPGWVSEAIDIAVRAEKRSLRYVHGILRRWKSEGKGASRPRLAGPAQRIDEPDQIVDPFDIAKGES